MNICDVPELDPQCLDIERLIPHRLPMRLAEQIVRVEDSSIETISVVRDTWPTAHHGQASSVLLIELIAQTAAALQGWKERHNKSAAVGGLLVGIPVATASVPTVAIGARLHCTVSITHGANNYRAFEGNVCDDQGTLLFTGSIQAYRPDDSDLAGDKP